MDDWRTIVASTEPIVWNTIAYVPRIISAFIVLFLGWFVAKFLRRAVVKFLRLVRMEEATERIGIDSFLLQGGVRYTAVTLVGEIIYWFLIFSVMLLALRILGMSEAWLMFSRITYYLPKVLIAMVILIFGSLIARFIHAIMFAYFDNIGIRSAYSISIIGQYAILAFVLFVALEQLLVDVQFLEDAFRIAFGALAIAFGIAFGLGGKWAAKNLLEKAFKDDKKGRT